MVEGTLDVQWANNNDPLATPRYRVNFLAYGGVVSGAQSNREFVGDEHLLNYFVELQSPTMSIERRTTRAKEWVLELKQSGNISKDNCQISEEQFAPFRRGQRA